MKTKKNGIIIDSIMADQLQALAVSEGLVRPNDGCDIVEINAERKQHLLQSLFLYGISHYYALESNLWVGGKAFKDLKICELQDPKNNSFPFRKGDNPTFEQVNASVEEAAYFSPLISEYTYNAFKSHLTSGTVWDEVFDISFKKLGARKTRKVIDSLPQLAMYWASGFWESAPLHTYPKEAVIMIEASYLDQSLVPVLLHFINEPKMLLAASQSGSMPILSPLIKSKVSTPIRPHITPNSAITVLKIAIKKTGLVLPKIDSLSALLSIRNDERIISLREVIREVTAEVEMGNVESVLKFEQRLQKAASELDKMSKIRSVYSWSFLVPLITSLAETALGVVPYASVAMSLGLAKADFALSRREQKNRWVWLCPPPSARKEAE